MKSREVNNSAVKKATGRQTNVENLTFREKVTDVLFHPRNFFERLSKSYSIKESVKYFLILNSVVAGFLLVIGIGKLEQPLKSNPQLLVHPNTPPSG